MIPAWWSEVQGTWVFDNTNAASFTPTNTVLVFPATSKLLLRESGVSLALGTFLLHSHYHHSYMLLPAQDTFNANSFNILNTHQNTMDEIFFELFFCLLLLVVVVVFHFFVVFFLVFFVCLFVFELPIYWDCEDSQ